jgi:hypothetical protein
MLLSLPIHHHMIPAEPAPFVSFLSFHQVFVQLATTCIMLSFASSAEARPDVRDPEHVVLHDGHV